jgi:hypothetical protein
LDGRFLFYAEKIAVCPDASVAFAVQELVGQQWWGRRACVQQVFFISKGGEELSCQRQ